LIPDDQDLRVAKGLDGSACLLDRAGAEMDGARAIRAGLTAASAAIMNRNLIALDAAAPMTRKRLLAAQLTPIRRS
jgi:hypothetical protein